MTPVGQPRERRGEAPRCGACGKPRGRSYDERVSNLCFDCLAGRPAAPVAGTAAVAERPNRYDVAWARRIVASIPRPTPAEEDAAARDYAETALSEAWAVLRRIADGDPNPRQIAIDLLKAHGRNLDGR